MPWKSVSEINWPLNKKNSGKFSSGSFPLLNLRMYTSYYEWRIIKYSMCEKSEELCQGRIDFFSLFFLGDNYGRQTGKYDAKNARLANQVPGFTGA